MNTTTIPAAGWIIVDESGLIWASGATLEACEEEIEATVVAEGGSTDDLVEYEASAALLAQVETQGGSGRWSEVDGVAVTYDEKDSVGGGTRKPPMPKKKKSAKRNPDVPIKDMLAAAADSVAFVKTDLQGGVDQLAEYIATWADEKPIRLPFWIISIADDANVITQLAELVRMQGDPVPVMTELIHQVEYASRGQISFYNALFAMYLHRGRARRRGLRVMWQP